MKLVQNLFVLLLICGYSPEYGLVLQHCPWDPNLREMRADCYMAQGDYFKAIGDIRPTTKLRNDNTAGYYKLSMLHYQMGEPDESLRYGPGSFTRVQRYSDKLIMLKSCRYLISITLLFP